MKKDYLVIALALTLVSSCGKKSESKVTETRPVKTVKVESRTQIEKDFAGIVEAVNFVKLAFRVGGQIINLPVVEGQRVEKGQLIAEIDTRELALQFAADKSSFETATAQLERNKRLLSKQAISQQEYEISESTYQKSKSAYKLSLNNMHDTKLYAPYAGSIEKKLAENFQRVTAGGAVVQLVNTNKLRIKFTIPDNYLPLLKGQTIKFLVEFDTYRGTIFTAKLEEFLDMSTDGTGVPVTVTIDDPKFNRSIYDVKPGFTCNVRLEAELGEIGATGLTAVPLTAVFESPGSNQPAVWIVNKDNVVERRSVEVYSPTGENLLLIGKGLTTGEVVVSAGVYQITEGETVNPIK